RFSSLLRVHLPHRHSSGEPLQLLGSGDLQLHPSSPHHNTKNELTISLRGGENGHGSPDIIAKVATNDAGAEAWALRLEEEARLYCNELRHLQGRVVPRKRVWSRWDVARAACMILEDSGDSLVDETLRAYLEDLPRSLKIEVMKNVLRLHKEAGCEHRELELENFVMRGNDLTSIRLIDFKYARVAHCDELDELENLLEIFKYPEREFPFKPETGVFLPRWLRFSHRHAQLLRDEKDPLRGRYSRFLPPKYRS
ncbi:hypothetical protein PILCRDRAFT_818330, partial [Piloderma croceum F 1598]